MACRLQFTRLRGGRVLGEDDETALPTMGIGSDDRPFPLGSSDVVVKELGPGGRRGRLSGWSSAFRIQARTAGDGLLDGGRLVRRGRRPARRLAQSRRPALQRPRRFSVYGQFSPARYEKLRAGDEQAVGDLLAKIRATDPSPTRDRTVALFRDVAATMHEGMLARRSSDRVKVDYDADAVEAKLTDDERTAAKALSQHAALDRLLITADPTATDRRVLGLLAAMDRMEMARGLPKQLKFYALGHVLTIVFDVAAPPSDALKPTATPPAGTWLAYLSGVASRAGYPSSDSPALTHKMRETLAWTGVGHGFADRLRRQVTALPNAAVPELSRIATEVAKRLETERATAETMSKAHVQNGDAK